MPAPVIALLDALYSPSVAPSLQYADLTDLFGLQ